VRLEQRKGVGVAAGAYQRFALRDDVGVGRPCGERQPESQDAEGDARDAGRAPGRLNVVLDVPAPLIQAGILP
jgi:hypothetical protein